MRQPLRTASLAAGVLARVVSGACAQDVLWQSFGDKSEDEFGSHVFAIGDMNGDGAGDFAVSAPTAVNFQGLIRVLDGKTGGKIFDVVGNTFTFNSLDSVADVGD